MEDFKGLKFTLPVVPHTKKNSSQFITLKNGRTALIPSKPYKQFEKDCLAVIGEELKLGISCPINIKAIFYTKTRRRIDLTNLLEALDDMLQKADVIADDCRDIIAGHDGSRVYHDKDNPRIEVEISKIDDYIQWKEDAYKAK